MKKRILSIVLCLCTLLSLLAVPAAAAYGFTDVAESDYFAKPVAWAVSEGITNGTSATTFSPNQTCTRAQILTFLWRAAGSPESVVFLANPYVDISEDAYYYQAALWAKEKGMVEGMYFRPDTPCTRAATVEYFWKYDGWKSAENVPFTDVSSGTQLAEAVSWAVRYGVTNGTGATTFSPNATCTRGQIVTFLHRYFVEPLDNSDYIAGIIKPSTPSAPPADIGKLDPLPPLDYTLQPDWYGSLTPASKMSNARLIAELKQIEAVIAERMEQDIYMSDGPYSRELDLWSAASQRYDKVKRYDRGVNNGSPAAWIVEEYNELIAAYGDADPLREYFN